MILLNHCLRFNLLVRNLVANEKCKSELNDRSGVLVVPLAEGGDKHMTQQIVDTELAFTQQFGSQEQQVLTEEAIEFLTDLVARFAPQRKQLLTARQAQQQK